MQPTTPFRRAWTCPRIVACRCSCSCCPYLEQNSLSKSWDFANPYNNTLGGKQALAATVLPEFVCPSDHIPNNPVMNKVSGKWYGMTSYGGNGGTRSFHPDCGELMADGVFFATGQTLDSRERPTSGSPG